jgi:hypothetical protein
MVFSLATTQVQKLNSPMRWIPKGHTPKILYCTIFGFVMMKVVNFCFLVELHAWNEEPKNHKHNRFLQLWQRGNQKSSICVKWKEWKLQILDFWTNDITKKIKTSFVNKLKFITMLITTYPSCLFIETL